MQIPYILWLSYTFPLIDFDETHRISLKLTDSRYGYYIEGEGYQINEKIAINLV